MTTRRAHVYVRRLCLALSACFLLALAACPAAALNPTPKGWDQWQPQTDTSDVRLERTVSVDEREIDIGDLLAHLSRTSGIRLEASDDLHDLPVTVFVEERRLSGLLMCLAEVADGYWFFPRGAEPRKRRYCLGRGSNLLTPDQRVERVLQRREESHHTPFVEKRRARLEEYASALDLSPEEVMELYEESDPWLCATVLDPALLPMIEEVCRLDDVQREQLHRSGELGFRVSEVSADFREHLALWARGEWGRRHGVGTPYPDPDRLPRFPTAEERWDNAAVRFWWHCVGLQAYLEIPDQGHLYQDIVRLKNDTPWDHWLRLISLGYRADTPEYRQRAKQRARQWWAENPHEPGEPERHAWLSGTPNISDPRLDLVVDLRELENRSVPTFLRHVASMHALPVVSAHLPPDLCSVSHSSEQSTLVTLRDMFEGLRHCRSGRVTWRFRGAYLVLKDVELDYVAAGRVPESLAHRWEELAVPGKEVSLEDLTSLIAATNVAQIDVLRQEPGSPLPGLYIHPLRAYGVLDASQRAQLREPIGVAVQQLRPDQRPAVLRCAREHRPWMTRRQVADAVLRAIPRTLASGQDGLSFMIEYPLPDGGVDRDVFLTSPLQIRIR
jgi:hypothetical protein